VITDWKSFWGKRWLYSEKKKKIGDMRLSVCESFLTLWKSFGFSYDRGKDGVEEQNSMKRWLESEGLERNRERERKRERYFSLSSTFVLFQNSIVAGRPFNARNNRTSTIEKRIIWSQSLWRTGCILQKIIWISLYFTGMSGLQTGFECISNCFELWDDNLIFQRWIPIGRDIDLFSKA
jgi:hypothetical protein